MRSVSHLPVIMVLFKGENLLCFDKIGATCNNEGGAKNKQKITNDFGNDGLK